MNNSCKIKIRTDRKKPDGSSDIYLQAIFHRKTKKIFLGVSWPIEKFDEAAGICKKRFKNDPDVDDYNMIIRTAISKANEIYKVHRLSNQNLTMDRFIREYKNHLSKTDFLLYFRDKMLRRYKRKEITLRSKKNHENTYNKLLKFYKELPFQAICKEKIEDFVLHLRHDLKLSQNTIWGHLKDVNTYLNMAKGDEKIIFDEGYKDVKVNPVDGKTEPLTIDEFRKLHDYYYKINIPYNHKRVLGPFLFACLTGGLRISDQLVITHDHIKEGLLILVPYKTRTKGKIVEIPILPEAMALIETKEGLLFNCMKEQKSNGILKEIAAVLEIKKNLHHHVARETFGTLYIEMGGNPAVLKELMGHSKYSITLRYVHINSNLKREQMKLMGGLLKAS